LDQITTDIGNSTYLFAPTASWFKQFTIMPSAVESTFPAEVNQIHKRATIYATSEALWMPCERVIKSLGKHSHVTSADFTRTCCACSFNRNSASYRS